MDHELDRRYRSRTMGNIRRHQAKLRIGELFGKELVIFNVKGNRYRLEVQVAYNTGVIVIRWAGTHAEYTKRMSRESR